MVVAVALAVAVAVVWLWLWLWLCLLLWLWLRPWLPYLQRCYTRSRVGQVRDPTHCRSKTTHYNRGANYCCRRPLIDDATLRAMAGLGKKNTKDF